MRKGIQPLIRPAAALLPVALALSACTTPGGTTGRAPPELAGTQWLVVEIDGRRPLGGDLTASFSVDGRISGDSGCNQFSGPYIQEGSTVRFGELLSTRRACVDTDRQQQESRMLRILDGDTVVRRERQELRVRGEYGVLVLSPQT